MKPHTEHGIRKYSCKKCGAPVEISHYQWRKFKTEEKKLCPDCIRRRNAPRSRYESSYSGFGTEFLGLPLGRFY